MKTYKLGNLGDSVLTVKKRDGQHVATLRIKNIDMKYVELPRAAFRQVGEVRMTVRMRLRSSCRMVLKVSSYSYTLAELIT